MSIGDAQPGPTEPRPLARAAAPAPARPRLPRAAGRIPPSTAAASRPLLVLLPVLTFLVPALLLAVTRAPVYSSEARLLVAGFDVQAAAIPGIVDASRSLASTYARLVETEVIVEPVVEELGISRGRVAGHISASAIPESAIIRVSGSSSSPEDAVRITTAAAEALARYAGRLGGTSEEDLLADYEAAATNLAQAQLELDQAEAAVQAATSGTAAAASARTALVEAQARVASAQLSADRAGGRYTAGGSGGGLQLVGPAIDAWSDKRSKIQLAIAGPTLLGLIVGVALATLVVNRDAVGLGGRRRDRSEPADSRT